MNIRLQKYLSHCGIASRRKSEELILNGEIFVNELVVNKLGTKIDTDIDVVKYKNNIVAYEDKIYIMINKPTGVVSTSKDQFARKTILDLVDIDKRIYNVGRLDYDTSGLLILTNDGEITNKLIHPRHHISKQYIATIKGIPTNEELFRFKNGLYIDGYKTSKANISILKKYKDKSVVDITIYEGKNRQIRKMCSEIDHDVIDLKRIAIGNLNLGNLKYGEYRYLNKEELLYLKSL